MHCLRPSKTEGILRYTLVEKSNPEELQINQDSINAFPRDEAEQVTASSKKGGE